MPVVTGSVPSSRERSNIPDLIGAAVLACCAVWSLVSAAGRDARPEGVLLALLAIAAGYAAGRIAGALLPVAAPAAAATVVAVAVAVLPDGLSGEPIAPPLGYANANAALVTLGAGAACCAAWATHVGALRLALRLLAAALAGVSLAIGSVAGCAASAGVLLCSLAAARIRRRLLGLAGLALCAALAVGATLTVATHAVPGTRSLESQLTQTRVQLWGNAVDLARADPWRGVGPDRFSEVSPIARADGNFPKPHSAALQQAAEQGVPGAVLLGCAYLWILLALWRSPRPTPVVLTAGAALTGLAVQASVDYVLSFAAVTAGAGLLAGMASARPMAEDPPQEPGEDRGLLPAPSRHDIT